MVLLIMHVITPLKKAQSTVLFVIKLQNKANLKEGKKKHSTRYWHYFHGLSC